nr:hypothetical protein [Tanacetum cinerariifolium]
MRAIEERQDGAFTSGSGKVQVNVIDSKFNEAQCAPTTIIANESNNLPSSCLSIVKLARRVMERMKSPAQDLHVVKAYEPNFLRALEDAIASKSKMEEVKSDALNKSTTTTILEGIAENVLVAVEGFIFKEDTMLELVKVCRQKELLCMHDNVDDLIKSALNTKLLSINSQHLDKKEQEVKNVIEQPAERGNRSIESLQNFKVIHKHSTSLNNASQNSPVHAVATILSTKEPEYSPSMGYEHSNTTPETESDVIIKSGVKELVPILSENEVTSEDKRECDVLVCEDSSTSDVCDDHSEIFSDSKINDDISSDDDDFEDVEYVEASLIDPEIVSVEEENDVEEEEIENFLNEDSIPIGVENSVDDVTSNDKESIHDIPIEESKVFTNPLFDDDSDGEIDDDLSFPRPPPEPPDEEFDFRDEISIVIDKLECINAKVEFGNDNYFSFMFAKVFSILSAKSEDTIFDPDDDDISIYDDFEDVEYVEASLSDPEIVSIEEENDVNQEEEEIDLEDISQIQDSDNSLSDNFSPQFETFCDHTEETRSGNTTHANNSLPEYGSFCFEIEPDQERLINVIKNGISNDSSSDPLLEEADLFFNSILPGIENFTDYWEGDIHFLEELLIDDSILSHESSDSNFEDNPSVPRPPPEPPDAEFDAGKEIPVVMNDKDKFDEDYYFFHV